MGLLERVPQEDAERRSQNKERHSGQRHRQTPSLSAGTHARTARVPRAAKAEKQLLDSEQTTDRRTNLIELAALHFQREMSPNDEMHSPCMRDLSEEAATASESAGVLHAEKPSMNCSSEGWVTPRACLPRAARMDILMGCIRMRPEHWFSTDHTMVHPGCTEHFSFLALIPYLIETR